MARLCRQQHDSPRVPCALHQTHQTSTPLRLPQYIFAGLYVATQAVVMALHIRAAVLPPWTLGLLCVSRRLHSIYVLRLFNDCWAMLVAYAATLALQVRADRGGCCCDSAACQLSACRLHATGACCVKPDPPVHPLPSIPPIPSTTCSLAKTCAQSRRWVAAVVLYSLAVSVKMNVLLMAPGVLAVLVKVRAGPTWIARDQSSLSNFFSDIDGAAQMPTAPLSSNYSLTATHSCSLSSSTDTLSRPPLPASAARAAEAHPGGHRAGRAAAAGPGPAVPHHVPPFLPDTRI